MNKNKIILASGSSARQQMLTNVGVYFDIIPAGIDEEVILNKMQNEGAHPQDISLKLAKEKALSISKQHSDKYIIGSDQILSMNNIIYSKAKNEQEARKRLLEFQGQEHHLTSSVCVVKNGEYLWSYTDMAALNMKALDSQAIDKYIKNAGSILTSCVGCYALEGIGIRLFKKIEGNYFTILGMPLLPLLNYLEDEGVL